MNMSIKIAFKSLASFYVAAKAFAQEPFLPTNIQPQHRYYDCLHYPPFGAPGCKCRITEDGETYTPEPRVRYKPYVSCGAGLANQCVRLAWGSYHPNNAAIRTSAHMRVTIIASMPASHDAF